jgi:hypothetical protein
MPGSYSVVQTPHHESQLVAGMHWHCGAQGMQHMIWYHGNGMAEWFLVS